MLINKVKKAIIVCILGFAAYLLVFSPYIKSETYCDFDGDKTSYSRLNGIKYSQYHLNISTEFIGIWNYTLTLQKPDIGYNTFAMFNGHSSSSLKRIDVKYSSLVDQYFLSTKHQFDDNSEKEFKIGWISNRCLQKINLYRNEYMPDVIVIEN